MEANSFWQGSSDTTTKAVQKIKTGIQKYFIVIVLLFNIVLQITTRLYRFGFQNTFSAEFFVSFFINTSTSMLCYICFIPLGKTDEMKRSTTFETLMNEWEKLTNKVRTGFLKRFEHFCFNQVEEERNESRRYILSNNTLISFDEYQSKYEGLCKKELKALLNKGEINKDEYKTLCKCLRVKIKPINPLIVLQGAKKTTVNDAGRDNGSYALAKALQRPIIMFVVSFIINTITTTYMGGSENVILEIMLSIFTIIISSVMGYSTGVNDFKHNEDRTKARVLFMSLFFESKYSNEDFKDFSRTRVSASVQTVELQPQENANSD